MGLGFGVYCERCGIQITYDMLGYKLKEDGESSNLCDVCAKIIEFDKRFTR